MPNNDNCEGQLHELWLIYCQLKDAEIAQGASDREELISSARARLGHALNRIRFVPKSPRIQADNLNCRCRQKGLTPDTQ